MDVEKLDRVVQVLQYCPICGEKLENHPITDFPACYMHGDFEVTEVKDSVRVEFVMTRW